MSKEIFDNLTKEELHKLYHDDNLSHREIGELFSVTSMVVGHRIRRFGIPRKEPSIANSKKKGGSKKKFTATKEELYKLYHGDGLTTPEISIIYGCADDTAVRKRIKEWGIPVKLTPYDQAITDKQASIVELYNLNNGADEISKITGYSEAEIYYVTTKFGIARSSGEGYKLAHAKGRCKNGSILSPEKLELITNREKLEKEYETQSLTDIAKKYKMDRALIVAAFHDFGIEEKPWSRKGHTSRRRNLDATLPQELLDEAWLRQKYEIELLSIEGIAELLDTSYKVVRNRLIRFGIKRREAKKYGYGHSSKSTYGVPVIYHPIKNCNEQIRFKSILECAYAVKLDHDDNVESWTYETEFAFYYDSVSEKNRKYICDFCVSKIDKTIENIEVKPLKKQLMSDKHRHALCTVENWRFIISEEIIQSIELFETMDLPIRFDRPFDSKKPTFWFWSTDDHIDVLPGYEIIRRKKVYKKYYAFKILNKTIDEPATKLLEVQLAPHTEDEIKVLDINHILDMIKANRGAEKIAKEFNITRSKIKKFLKDESYNINWGTGKRCNEIWHDSKMIWPVDVQPEVVCTIQYEWDNYEWLNEHYTIKGMTTTEIGKLVGKNRKVISSKLRLRGIQSRSPH